MKFGEKLFQTKLLSRLSHKVCRLLPSPVLLRKFTIVSRREITPSTVYLATIHSINYTCTKLTTHGKNLFDSSKRYVATKTASFQLQKWNT